MGLIIKDVHLQLIRNVQLNLLLLIYMLMSMFKDYIIIHLQLIYIDALEVFILLMTSLIKCVFQIKQKSFQHNCRNKLIKTIYKANMNINANINVNLI